MPLLKDVARYVRSKTAGPFWVTIDVFCRDRETFVQLRDCPLLSAASVAALYAVPPEQIAIFPQESLNVIKISFPRRIVQGSKFDADSHAGQYFVPLARLLIDAPALAGNERALA